VVLYRRFMIRIAEDLATRYKNKAIVTGESLGQVASQTLDNISVIDEVARGPILRPSWEWTKDEISVERAGSEPST
jgi:thiamine biosynthesis protein ThiI